MLRRGLVYTRGSLQNCYSWILFQIRDSTFLFYRPGGHTKMVTLTDARRVIAAAEKKAAEIKQPMNIAVADGGGNLVSHERMDGAWGGSSDVSIKKAYTSRAFDIATKDLATHSQSGGQFFGMHSCFKRREDHDFCRRNPVEEGRKSGRRDRSERRIGRAGSRGGRSRSGGVLDRCREVLDGLAWTTGGETLPASRVLAMRE